MLFEKWESLGNDYIIVEDCDESEELTPAVIARLCNCHSGIGADGLIKVSRETDPGYVASLQIFNADGSEAEISGNGSRQAALFVHHNGWAPGDEFSLLTKAGEVRVNILGDGRCQLALGSARLVSKNFTGGSTDGRGVVKANGSSFEFQHVTVGNPQCVIRLATDSELDQLELTSIGPDITCASIFPNRTNVSFWAPLARGHIRARIFERGVGETESSGTGACGAAVDYVLRGGDSPVKVELDGGDLSVAVDEALAVRLTGEAQRVYRGELDSKFFAKLT